jgi:hypothetical protein
MGITEGLRGCARGIKANKLDEGSDQGIPILGWYVEKDVIALEFSHDEL